MKKRVLAIAMATLLCAGVFAGCGSSSNSSASSGSATSAASSGSTSVAASTSAEATTSTAATGDAEYAMVCGTSVPDAHPYCLGMVRIGELLAEKTDGAVTLDVFGNSQLGSERDLIEGLQLGTVQMTTVSTAPLAGFTDMFLVFDLPFLFPDTETARKVLDSEVGMEILHSIEDQGIKGVAWFENGFRNVTNNVRQINVPDDLKGIKIRTMENQMHMDAFSIMGADPTPMAMGDLFTALQQGTIDAEENPIPIIETNKFQEVQDYLSMTGHLFSPAPVFISTDYFNALPEEYQTAVLEASEEAVPYQRQQIDEQNVSGLEALQADGMEVAYPDQEPFKEVTAPLYDKYIQEGAGMVSPDIYQRVLDVMAE